MASLPGPVRGAVAGLTGTAAMTAAQTAYQRATQTPQSTTPAAAVRTVVKRVSGNRIARRRTPELTWAAHVAYGTGWGVAYGIGAPRATPGVAFGAGVWGASLVMLPALGVAEPVWRQDPRSVAPDLAFHLVYGATVAEADRALREEPAPATGASSAAALALGASAGMRTFTAPAALALTRGAPTAGRVAAVVAAVGELVGDKLPATPDRRTPPPLAGRLASGAAAGRQVAGARGALLGGAAAVTTALAVTPLRERIGKALGAPDPLVALAEDALAIALAAVAARTTAPAPG